MAFTDKNKTNWKYILVVVVVAIIAGAGLFWFLTREEISPPLSSESEKLREADEHIGLEQLEQRGEELPEQELGEGADELDKLMQEARSQAELFLANGEQVTVYLFPLKETCEIYNPSERPLDPLAEAGSEICSGEYNLVTVKDGRIIDSYTIDYFDWTEHGYATGTGFLFAEGTVYDGTLYVQELATDTGKENFIVIIQDYVLSWHDIAHFYRIDSETGEIERVNFFLKSGGMRPSHLFIKDGLTAFKTKTNILIEEDCANSGMIWATEWHYKDGDFYEGESYEVRECD